MTDWTGAVEEDGIWGSDQPSIIYAFDDDDGEQIRELARDGSSAIRPRTSTQSEPTERLPKLDLPGNDGTQQDDCGDDLPAFFCTECGSPRYIGRTCYSPLCERCWPAAIKNNVVSAASKLDGLRRRIYSDRNATKNVDFNHVVASLPEYRCDSDEPLEHALKSLKTLLEDQWHIEGFLAIYHPYRIRAENRMDQYDHGGRDGEGDMTWADVLTSDDPEQYLYHSPHFHLFFPAVRKSFDYSVVEAVEDQSGWLFKRITKNDSNVSVSDFEDLVHQLTYCYSHAGTSEDGIATRMKGKLHNTYAPDGLEDQALAAVCDAAPKLLGHQFANTNAASCEEEVVAPPDDDTDDGHTHFAGGDGSGSSSTTEDVETTPCGGDLESISKATQMLADEDWREQAQHADALETAVEEWKRIKQDVDDLDELVDSGAGDTPPPA